MIMCYVVGSPTSNVRVENRITTSNRAGVYAEGIHASGTNGLNSKTANRSTVDNSRGSTIINRTVGMILHINRRMMVVAESTGEGNCEVMVRIHCTSNDGVHIPGNCLLSSNGGIFTLRVEGDTDSHGNLCTHGGKTDTGRAESKKIVLITTIP